MTVDPFDDRVCNCGKTGCLELYASATGIVYETKKALKDYKEATILRDLDEVTAKDIFDAAKEGDTFAKERVDDLDVYKRQVSRLVIFNRRGIYRKHVQEIRKDHQSDGMPCFLISMV